MKYIITESQYKAILLEYYDSERLYSREHIVRRLSRAPRYIKEYIKNLPKIHCVDNNGNDTICTKIPEVIYQFLNGNF